MILNDMETERKELNDRICRIIKNYNSYRNKLRNYGAMQKIEAKGRFEGFSYDLVFCPDAFLKETIFSALMTAEYGRRLFLHVDSEGLQVAQKATYQDYLYLAAVIMNCAAVGQFLPLLWEDSVFTINGKLAVRRVKEQIEMIKNPVFEDEASFYFEHLKKHCRVYW